MIYRKHWLLLVLSKQITKILGMLIGGSHIMKHETRNGLVFIERSKNDKKYMYVEFFNL